MHHDAKYIEYPTATQPSITIPLTTLNPPRAFLPDSLWRQRRGGWANRDLLPHCTKLGSGCLLCPSCPAAQPARLWEKKIYIYIYKSRVAKHTGHCFCLLGSDVAQWGVNSFQLFYQSPNIRNDQSQSSVCGSVALSSYDGIKWHQWSFLLCRSIRKCTVNAMWSHVRFFRNL